MIRKKILVLGMSGILAAGLFGGAAISFAQTAQADTAVATTSVASVSSLIRVHDGGRGGPAGSDQALADALGIDLTELETAEATARAAMIDQAVTDGLLTEAQAEQLKASGMGFGRGFGGYDRDEYLADALGITVEELQAAELTAFRVELDAAVAAGTLTQEEADLILARKAAQNYVDEDGLNAAALAAYEDALTAAVADGAITQAQADALLAEMQTQSFNFGLRGFGGHDGFGGRGGHGGRGGFGLDVLPGTTPDTTPDTTVPDTTTDTAFDA